MRNVMLTALDNGEYVIHKDTRKQKEKAQQRVGSEAQVLLHLRQVLAKQEHDDFQVHIQKEWEDVALVLDRLLFWVYFLLGTSATMSLLVFKPMMKDLEMGDLKVNWMESS